MSDLISRQTAIDAINDRIKAAIEWGKRAETDEIKTRAEQAIATFCEASLTLKKLPSAQPRKGKWIKQHDEGCWWYECSCCGDYPLKSAYGDDQLSDFCPWCGASMVRGETDEQTD